VFRLIKYLETNNPELQRDKVRTNVIMRYFSVNNFFRAKELSVTYSECVSVALGIRHVPYYIVICSLSGSNHILPHYLINGTIFGNTEHKIYFDFLYKFRFQTSLILRRNE